MKILHYIPTYAPAWKFGGPVLSVSRLCEGLARLGHDVEVITSTAGIPDSAGVTPGVETNRNGVRVTYFAQGRGMGISSDGMESAVRERVSACELLHVTGVWQRTSVAACRSAFAARVPYVVSPRGALGPYSWRQKTLKKAVYYFARERRNVNDSSAIHFTAEQEALEADWLRLTPRAFVVPNPVDPGLQRDRQRGLSWRTLQGIPPDVTLLVVVGRLHHKKGLDLLPAALARLESKRWRLLFIGDDEDGTAASLKRALAVHGLGGSCRFLPACPPGALAEVYSGADLLLLPSRHENFGNVVAEALSCGCPVVLSPAVALAREVALHGAGLSVERTPEAWGSALEGLLRAPQAVEGMGKAGAAWAAASFAVDKVASQMLTEYQRTIEGYGNGEHR